MFYTDNKLFRSNDADNPFVKENIFKSPIPKAVLTYQDDSVCVLTFIHSFIDSQVFVFTDRTVTLLIF